MARREAPPFRADHVGSLLRPPALHAARADFAAGKTSAAELEEVEDAAIRDAVRLQEDAGLKSATDGEFRREQWHSDFIYSIPGVEKGALIPAIHAYREGGEVLSWQPNIMEITAKLRLSETIFGDHFRFLRDTVTTATPKITSSRWIFPVISVAFGVQEICPSLR